MGIEQPSENRQEISEQESFQKFWEILREEGWVSFDGEDYCPDCWESFKNRMKEEGDNMSFLNDAAPVSRISKSRKLRDAWYVDCYGPGIEEKCPGDRSVCVPFEEQENQLGS